VAREAVTREDVARYFGALRVRGGEPYTHVDWQWRFTNRLFARAGRRTGLLWIPRKNGKTFYAAALGVHDLCFGPEMEPEVVLAARNTYQADKLYQGCLSLLAGTPALRSLLVARKRPNRIERRDGAGMLKVIAADADSAQGLNPSFAILDELHVARNDELWEALSLGMGYRAHPVLMGLSTAGDDVDSFGHEMWEMAMHPPRNVIAQIHHAPSGDPGDRETWKAANPSWGTILQPSAVEEEWRLAAARGRAGIQSFERFRLNRWTSPVSAWEVADKWDEWASPDVTWDAIHGREAWGGLDIGQVNDLTGMVLAVPDVAGKTALVSVAWVADENATRLGTEDQVRAWRDAGWLRITPAVAGKTDLVRVAEDILELVRPIRLTNIGIDRGFQSAAIGGILSDGGLEVHEVGNAPSVVSPAIRDLEEDLFGGLIHHDGSPIFAQHVRNADKRVNERDESKLVKRRRDKRIDLADAMIYAHSQLARGPAIPKPRVVGWV